MDANDRIALTVRPLERYVAFRVHADKPTLQEIAKGQRAHTTGLLTLSNGARVRFPFQGNKVFELVNVDGTLSPKL